MGVIANECLRNSKSLENEDSQNSSLNENIPSDFNRFSLLNGIPENEIKSPDSTRYKIPRFLSLSRLPISTKNVIRRQIGKPFSNYDIIGSLGNGAFGKVYKVMHKLTGNIRAMKIINKNNLHTGFTDDDIIQEINILKSIDHPQVIKLYEFYLDEENYYLINEYCSEGDLLEKIYRVRKLPEFLVKILMLQIFNALKYLNSKGIIHGDLKLDNIIIDSYLYKEQHNNLCFQTTNFFKSLEYDINKIDDSFLKNKNLRNLKYSVEKIKKVPYYPKDPNNHNKPTKKKNINKEKVQEDNKNNNKIKDTNNKKKFKEIICRDLLKKWVISKENRTDTHRPKRAGSMVSINKDYSFPKKKQQHLDLNKLKIKNFGLKLIDFGCSKIFNKNKKNFRDAIGTVMYSSPEVLRNNYNEKCDVWSCGVIMYLLLCGFFPFSGIDEDEASDNIIKGDFSFHFKEFDKVSLAAKDLIKRCLTYDTKKRISVEEAIKHPFFYGLNPNNIFNDDIDCSGLLESLKNYNKRNKFYQAVLTYLSHNFAQKEDLNNLRKIFYKIDLDLDGKISKDELSYAYEKAGIKIENEQLENIIDSIDSDGNGYIEYEEFIRVSLPKDKLFTNRNLKVAFDLFDLDKNGTVSINEIKEIFENIDEIFGKELKKQMNTKDQDEINFEQFKNMILDFSNK